jgi:hypothetical protein
MLFLILPKNWNQKLETTITTLFNNQLFTGTLTMFLFLYIIYSSVTPPQFMINITQNDIGRFIWLLWILYFSFYHFDISILLTIAYLVTIYNDSVLEKKIKNKIQK